MSLVSFVHTTILWLRHLLDIRITFVDYFIVLVISECYFGSYLIVTSDLNFALL